MRYGRLPRTRDPRIPHMSALMAGNPAPVVPQQVNWTQGMPQALGMLGNNQLGDCAEAGFGHAQQVWTYHTRPQMASVTTEQTEKLYSEVTGYKPGDPSTDQGTILQELLKYLVKTGQLFAFIELDPLRPDHLDLATYQGALLYLGFEVPKYLELEFGPGAIWGVNPNADNTIAGRHCVISGGYRPDGVREIVSWGSANYSMTRAFWEKRVDEAYVLLDTEWLEKNGKTFAGYTMDRLDQQMAGIREGT